MNLNRFLDWTFDGSAVGHEGWGVLADNWGGYDVSGFGQAVRCIMVAQVS